MIMYTIKLKLLLPLIVITALSGCTMYSVNRGTILNKEPNSREMYGTACPNPTYIATMGINAMRPDSTFAQEKLTMYNLLKEARKKYGEDVTIENVRWDRKNTKNISAVFDVIKCK